MPIVSNKLLLTVTHNRCRVHNIWVQTLFRSFKARGNFFSHCLNHSTLFFIHAQRRKATALDLKVGQETNQNPRQICERQITSDIRELGRV